MHKIGVRALAILSALCQLSGCLVFILVDDFYGKVAGRVIFGLGLGPQEVPIPLLDASACPLGLLSLVGE